MRWGGARRTGQFTVAATVIALGAPLCAQDSGGLEANLSFAQGLTLSSEEDNYGQTDIGFSLTSATRSQSFAFDITTTIEERLNDGFNADIVDPRIALSYSIESKQTLLETDFQFRQSDADTLISSSDLPGLLVLDQGTRETRNADINLAFGRESRFGGTLGLGYDTAQFDGTTSAELIDTTTTSGSLALRFEIDRRVTGTLGYDITQTDRDGGRDSTNEGLNVGVDLDITKTLGANLSLGQSRIRINDGLVDTTQTGTDYAIALTQERPNGEISFDLSSDITEAGRRTSATIGRTLETRGGAFSARLGATRGDSSDVRPLAALSYTEELARGSFAVNLDQSFSTSTDGFDTLNSRLRLDWQQDLTRTSRYSTDLTYQMSDILGTDEESARLDLGLRFSRDLTEDWAVTTRYVHSRLSANGQSDQQENTLFIGLETTLGWRP